MTLELKFNSFHALIDSTKSYRIKTFGFSLALHSIRWKLWQNTVIKYQKLLGFQIWLNLDDVKLACATQN